MFFGAILIIFSFVATAMPECQNHDKIYAYHDGYNVKILDITDLGLAALYNVIGSVEKLIMEVR